MTKLCVVCGSEFKRFRAVKFCSDKCRHEKTLRKTREYQSRPEYREMLKAWRRSERGKEWRKRYDSTPEAKAKRLKHSKKWNSSVYGKNYMKAYNYIKYRKAPSIFRVIHAATTLSDTVNNNNNTKQNENDNSATNDSN